MGQGIALAHDVPWVVRFHQQVPFCQQSLMRQHCFNYMQRAVPFHVVIGNDSKLLVPRSASYLDEEKVLLCRPTRRSQDLDSSG